MSEPCNCPDVTAEQRFLAAGTHRQAVALDDAGFGDHLRRRQATRPMIWSLSDHLRDCNEDVFRALLPEEKAAVVRRL